jgi:hypothetical protein
MLLGRLSWRVLASFERVHIEIASSSGAPTVCKSDDDRGSRKTPPCAKFLELAKTFWDSDYAPRNLKRGSPQIEGAESVARADWPRKAADDMCTTPAIQLHAHENLIRLDKLENLEDFDVETASLAEIDSVLMARYMLAHELQAELAAEVVNMKRVRRMRAEIAEIDAWFEGVRS